MVISNKNVAKVYVKNLDDGNTSTDSSTTGGYELDNADSAGFRALGKYEVYFNIGSVDGFERKLDSIQEEMVSNPLAI